MKKRGMAAVAMVPGPNFFYFTGLTLHRSERLTLALIRVDGRIAFFLPALERTQTENAPHKRFEVFTYSDSEGPDQALLKLAGKMDLQNRVLGIEFRGMWVGEERALQQAAGGISITPADELFMDLRMIKDDDELTAMRQAIRIAEAALSDTVGEMAAGQTEREIATRLQVALTRHGSDPLPFLPIVVAGPNAASPHALPGDRPIRAGDIVTIDCGASWGGYASDITRNVAVGEITEELEHIHSIVWQANGAGRAAVRPGIPAEDVDAATRAVIEEAGYGAYFTHRTGHGLGLDIHEPPYVVGGNRAPLRAGMTFTIEPGIYLPGLGGVRIEDDVVVTADGTETLTKFPRKLLRIAAS
ncbi:MAG: aminopeptidase P family protein [Chloroflexi bacterium]|nr:aminopeptidase P family protein [Chloroflexota bacterium]